MCYIYCVCVCSLRYPVCKAREPNCCHLSPSWLYCIFPRSHKLHDFRNKFLDLKCMCWFPLQILSENFLLVRRTEWDMIKMFIGLYIKCRILIKLEFLCHIFEKYSNIKFRKNPSSESRVHADWRTDRHNEANSRISKFCKRSWKSVTFFVNWIM
jgi:hypothetical protein